MGTSRGPIREAIKVLAGLGIVTAVPNKGVFVRQLSLREMLEIYELNLQFHALVLALSNFRPGG